MEVDEYKSSKFNAGVLQTQRIHDILTLLNSSKINPLAWNIEQADWNFNVIFSCIENIYGEIEGFLNAKESDFIIQIKEKVTVMMKNYPIKENQKKPNITNELNYEILIKALSYYERIVKRLGVKYKILVAFESKAGMI